MRWYVFSAVSVACTAFGIYYATATPEISTFEALEMFAIEETRNAENASDILLKSHSSFAGIGCAAGQTREDVAEALEIYLTDVPQQIRASILEKALPMTDGEFSSSLETDKTNSGHTTFVLAFWHSRLHGNDLESCISVAGTVAEFADKVIGTSIRKVQNTVGYAACACTLGPYFCSSCPLVEEVEERVPLVVPTHISIKQHKDMQAALRVHAVDLIAKSKRKPAAILFAPPEVSADALDKELV